MGTINDGAMKNWNNGDVVNEALYEADREMLRVAINDNFARLMKSITILNADGTTKTTTSLQAALNFVKIKDGAGVSLTMDGAGIVTISAVPAASSVNTVALQDGSVTTAKIADANVTAAKLAANAVGTTNIQADSIGPGHIADGAITGQKIADGSITGSKLDPAIATNSPQVEAHNGDPNAHTSIRTSITDHTGNTSNPHNVTAAQTGALAASAYTAADVLTKIKTVDGAGSGLDADTVKGYVPVNKAGDTMSGALAVWPSGSLGTGAGNLFDILISSASNGSNITKLYTRLRRNSAGSSWPTADIELLRVVDVSEQQKIVFAGSGNIDFVGVANVTIPSGNLIIRGDVLPGLRQVSGGYLQVWDGGQWKSPGNAHVISLFSSDVGVQNTITSGSYNPLYTTIGAGYSGSFDDYQFYVDDAIATGRTCYFECVMRMDVSGANGIVRLRDPNDGTVFVDCQIAGSTTSWTRIRSAAIGPYIGGHTLHFQMLNNSNRVQVKSMKLIFI